MNTTEHPHDAWLGRQHPFPDRNPYDEACVDLATAAIRSGNLYGIGGQFNARLEDEFAKSYGVAHAVAVSSGTAAIHTAIAAFDPPPGSEIITAPITDAGTIVPIIFQGCVPIFADLDEHLGMDPASVESLITERTAAIVVVHLFGNATDVESIAQIAARHDIPLLEDCSQAHQTHFRGRTLGCYGTVGMFSFQQSKHMTTGDGGMVITDDDAIAERMRLFRDKGWARAGFGARAYPVLGLNYRMTELQAAVGIPQIGKVGQVIAKRRELADRIDSHLEGVAGVRRFVPTPGCEASYWCYPFFVDNWTTAAFADALAALGVPTLPGYIGDPIYQCMSVLRDGRTFGGSDYPLGPPVHPEVRYESGCCPRAEEHLRHLMVFWMHEGYSLADADDVGRAIARVASDLAVSVGPAR